RGVAAVAAAARRGVRDRRAVLPRRRGGGLGSIAGVASPRGAGLMSLLSTERLTKAFGALIAVDDVSLNVEQGTLHSVIGPNGAGKTTLFNLLTGQYAPTTGRIMFDGRDIAGTPPPRIAHLGIARSFQRTNVFPSLSVLENVWVAAFARSSWRGLAWRPARRYPELQERAMTALGEVGLEDKAGHAAREISHG